MDTLPNETLVKVLGCLNYDDLLIAKNVCKRFRSAVGYIIDRSTVWVKEENECSYRNKRETDYSQFAKLFYDFENNNPNRCLISRQWRKFRLITDFHPNVRKLILSNSFLISCLNTFVNLVHLEMFTESWALKDFYFDFKRLHHTFNFENFEQLEHFEHQQLEHRENLDPPEYLEHLELLENNDLFVFNVNRMNDRDNQGNLVDFEFNGDENIGNFIRDNDRREFYPRIRHRNNDREMNRNRAENSFDNPVLNGLREYAGRYGFKRDGPNAIYLNLKKLEVLYFLTDFSFKKTSIILNCPSLKKLTTDSPIDCFKFNHPNSIDEITCEENNFALCQFKNLKKLTCFYFNHHNHLVLFRNLRNLSEFYFYKMEDTFLNLNYNNVKIYFKNIEFLPNQTLQVNLRKLSGTSLNDSGLEFYTKNSKILSQTTGLIQKELRINTFKYTNSDVIKQLVNLKIFHINYDEADQRTYIEIFKVCNLDKLIIRSPFASIDQEFLDLIPIYNSTISFLKVDDFSNLKFLLSLKYLVHFKTEEKFFDFNLLKQMFDCLHDLKSIEILITVDIFKFKIVDDKIVCSYNHETFLEEQKQLFIKSSYQMCIYKLYELFITNYK